MIDSRLSVNVVILPSLYFQMFLITLCRPYMNNDHHLCISFMHMYVCITVSDFIFLRTIVYHIEGIFATDAAA